MAVPGIHRLTWGAVSLTAVAIVGCGLIEDETTVLNTESRPAFLSAAMLEDMVTTFLGARSTEIDAAKAAALVEAEAIERLLLTDQTLAEYGDASMPLRVRVLAYAADYPNRIEHHTGRVRAALQEFLVVLGETRESRPS